ncbi:MAG: hypothetical protein R3337_12155 [Gammaproteobacteria bacterium]|nr:hypothetical protein [Gammaproteobacteria bacterium]
MSNRATVGKMDPSKKNSPITESVEEESTVVMDNVPNKCVWNDREFNEGQQVECDGQVFECNYGHWVIQK